MSTDNQSTKELYIEFFKTQELLRHIVNFLPLSLMSHKGKSKNDVLIQPSIESIRNQAKSIGLANKSFERLLGLTINSLLKDHNPKALANYIRYILTP